MPSCLHCFCFSCIQKWATRTALCPLCRQPFDRVLHTVRADDDYQEYVVRSSTCRCWNRVRRGPRTETRGCAGGPVTMSPQLGVIPWAVAKCQGVTELKCPQAPAPVRLLHPVLLWSEPHQTQGGAWSAVGMEHTSSSARCCCLLYMSSSPFREPSKHPNAFHVVVSSKPKNSPLQGILSNM